jgi:isoquinoline 1-oxidoreductase alpha subunit
MEDRVAAYSLALNGAVRKVDVDPAMPLLWVLRDQLDLKGTKFGCGVAQCGACTVHLNGVPTRACITPVSSVGTRAITTIEGIEQTTVGKKVQAAWLNIDVAQCGYCQAGQIMAASALLTAKPKPTDADIDGAMDGNLCRCATYPRIRAAIKEAAGLHTSDTRPIGGE